VARPAALVLSAAILREHNGAACILFYGSCLRKQTNEGVFDFYVLVDRYSDTYSSRLLAAGNALLPPNVFYLETESEWGTLRTKYAVISMRDFEACVQPSCIHPYIWARFAQPAAIVYSRDEASKNAAIRGCSQAIITLIRRLSPFLPASDRKQRFTISRLWQEAFRRTYGAERRAESDESVQSIYDSAPTRYDAAGRYALEALNTQGWVDRLTPHRDGSFEVEMPEYRRSLGRLRWQFSRPVARVIALGRLIKTAFTFGDWVPYAVWKMERHTGEKIHLTDRQRSHPFIFAWPVIWRVYLRR
jgi:hypothetical protein